MIATVEDLDFEMLSSLRTLELRGNKLRSTSGIELPSLRNLFLVCIIHFQSVAGSGIAG